MIIIIDSLSTPISEIVKHAHYVREKVFQEGQGIDKTLDFDGKDNVCIQIVAMDNSQPVGTVRLRKLDNQLLKVERLAVLSEYRGKGVGKDIMDKVKSIAKSQNFNKLVLNSQMSAKAFYDKLGFVPEGEVFEEASIPHIKMSINV